MATSEQACRRAVMASQEVILENCEGTRGTIEEIGDEVFAFVPDDDQEDFAVRPGEDVSGRQLDRAIDSCVDSAFAEKWAEIVVGEDAPREARERAQRRVCEGLFG